MILKIEMKFGISNLNVVIPMNHESVGPHVQSRRIELVVKCFTYFNFHELDLALRISVIRGLGEVRR